MKDYIIPMMVGVAIVLAINVLKMQRQSGANKITAAEMKAKIDANENYILLDVRTPDEFASAHIPTAKNFPDYEIKADAETRLQDKNAFIIVYCKTGVRSSGAAKNLLSLGYTNVHDLGGIVAWPYEIEKCKQATSEN